jgi:hypothetical protein
LEKLQFKRPVILVQPLLRSILLKSLIQITVYNLSILANVPLAIQSILPSDLPPLRLRPLFNIGIHDIPFLESLSKPSTSSQSSSDDLDSTWVACTTDHVLATKTQLYDILVTLPPPYSKNAPSKIYPKLSTPHPPPSKANTRKKPSRSPYPQQYAIKATQRDARRYVTLRRGLRKLPRSDPLAPTFPKLNTASPGLNAPSQDDSDALSSTSSTTPSILEPLSWPLFAYNSFIWWASAGEARTDLEEESTHDTDLLFTDIDNLANTQPNTTVGLNSTSPLEVNLPQTPQQPEGRGRRRGRSISQIGFGRGTPVREMALVAYFHRLTTLMFSTLADVIAREDGEDEYNDDVDDAEADTADYPDADEDGGQDNDQDNNSSHVLNPIKNGNRKNRKAPNTTDSAPLLPQDRNEADEEDDDAIVNVAAEDVTSMGLDVWSEADRRFIGDVAGLWFGRRARVKGGVVECCGVRVY